LEDELGELDDRHREFSAICKICEPRKHLAAYRWVGNPPSAGPPKDRLALCKAFIDKAVWDFPTTSALIDAVVIVTPDHWHTLAAIDAARAGKDVYCEKPVSLTICQGRELAQAVRRCGRIFQTGTQYRSIPAIRKVCQFVREGGIGRVKSVFTNWDSVAVDLPLPAEPVPDGLDWDLWVGPAMWHAYNRRYHTNPIPGVVPWSFCDDFGAASVTGFHSHAADVIQYALGMETSGPVEIIHPDAGLFPTLTCRYANGTLLHHVKAWSEVAGLYGAVPATARLGGCSGGCLSASAAG
jgi:hypothetical protein